MLARPGAAPATYRARVAIDGERIASVEAEPELKAAPESDADHLLMPALANAHDHGRGVRYLAQGAFDRPLESWLPSVYFQPDVDPYVNAAVSMGRHLAAGIAASVHCHIVNRPEKFDDEMRGIARAANDIGIRLALVAPMRDQNLLAYGPDEDLLALVPQEARAAIVERWGKPPLPPKEQVARVQRLGEELDGERVEVLFGPIAPQWASRGLLEQVGAESARTGRRVHMHLLETRYQREWADAAYPQGLVRMLDEIGLLSPRLTVAHGTYLKPGEIELLAARDVVISLNSCSNLRVRAGIAPARASLGARMAMGIGLDALTLDDDNDAFRELRLARLLHSGPGFAESISAAQLYGAAMGAGARAVTGKPGHGAIAPGAPADLLVLDYGALAGDVMDGLVDEADLVLARASSRHVHAVYVAGRKVLESGRVLALDSGALEAELQRQVFASRGRLMESREHIRVYQGALERFYGEGWHARPRAA